MFCPQCGATQPDKLNFCKTCGANLGAVRTALVSDPKKGSDKFDWNKTWVAEMMMSSEESVRRAAELDRLKGITPETKRRTEIKAGVITASAGAGLMILLLVLMEGIVAGGVSDKAAAILSRIWIAGVLPLFVGLALIVNGMFISKRGDGTAETGANELTDAAEQFLPPADTNELAQKGFSVTEDTTRHLKTPR